MRSRHLAITSALSLLLAPLVIADDWAGYRGPEGAGRSAESNLLSEWPSDGPTELWRATIGGGYSGLTVAGERVYTLSSRGRDEVAIALDAASGETVWQVRLDENRSDDQGDGPRSTPTVDGDLVYALGARGKLFALEVGGGFTRWTRDLVDDFGAPIPRWGVSTSPLVEGDLLIVDVGGRSGHSLVAFDKLTGEVRWTSGGDKPGYSTPVAVTIGSVRQIVSFSGTELISANAATGELLWRHPWSTSYDVNAAMPVFLPPNRIFISSSYDTGATVLEIASSPDGFQVRPSWKSRVMKNHFNSSVLVDGFLYGFDNGTLKCVDPASGDEKWAARGFAKGSLLYADGKLVILSERGVLALAEADPGEYTERSRFQVFKTKTWTMPTLANGRLFVRDQSELIALDLREQ